MSDIFISYAREDRTQAERLARALETRGWSVWWDATIPAGKAFHKVIEEAIEATGCVIVLWSRSSVESQWVYAEAEEGNRRNILVPVLIEEAKVPLGFRTLQAVDLVGWQGADTHPEFCKLVTDLTAMLGPPKGACEDSVAHKRDEGRRGVAEAPVPEPPAAEEGQRTILPFLTKPVFWAAGSLSLAIILLLIYGPGQPPPEPTMLQGPQPPRSEGRTSDVADTSSGKPGLYLTSAVKAGDEINATLFRRVQGEAENGGPFSYEKELQSRLPLCFCRALSVNHRLQWGDINFCS